MQNSKDQYHKVDLIKSIQISLNIVSYLVIWVIFQIKLLKVVL
jgi:hypothetical protein